MFFLLLIPPPNHTAFLALPNSGFEAPAISLPLPPALLDPPPLLPSSGSLPCIFLRFQHQVYTLSLLQSPAIILVDSNTYMKGPPSLMASSFLNLFISSDQPALPGSPTEILCQGNAATSSSPSSITRNTGGTVRLLVLLLKKKGCRINENSRDP